MGALVVTDSLVRFGFHGSLSSFSHYASGLLVRVLSFM